VRRELRAGVIYGRHNVLTDPPISRLDVMVCRNLLIYFDNPTQQQILTRFHYALRNDGFLFLGKAETLMARSLLFRPIEPRFRISQRVPQPGAAEAVIANLEMRRLGPQGQAAQTGLEAQNYALHAVVEDASDPVLLLDGSGTILMASRHARELLAIN